MSKRFGRNQKRKLVQIIAGQNALVNKLMIERTMLKGKISGYEDTIRLTALVLGTHFCTLPPEVISAHGLDRSSVYRMAKPTEFKDAMFNPPNMLEMKEWTARAVRELDIYRAELRTNELSDSVHVQIQGPNDEHYGYALSREMKHSYPKNQLIERISRELALLMVRSWSDGRP